ncbi:MAG: hypothetical protein HYZ87_02900 [Candidatus Omnitrophica bacterium]|nr:hypothetical protein [Candidatus Omnitrophota bacterium]
MKLFELTSKKILRFSPKACEFLKGYSTQVCEAPKGAFVDLRGRVVALFYQKKISEDEALVVMESSVVEPTILHLDRYLRLMGTAALPERSRVYFDFEKSYVPGSGEWVIPEAGGQLVLTAKNLKATATEDDYTLFRLKHSIPLQGVDFQDEMLLNIGDEDYVSYTKGCYFGQEIVARVHFRSKPPQKLAVKAEDELGPEAAGRLTSKTFDPGTGKVWGFIKGKP